MPSYHSRLRLTQEGDIMEEAPYIGEQPNANTQNTSNLLMGAFSNLYSNCTGIMFDSGDSTGNINIKILDEYDFLGGHKKFEYTISNAGGDLSKSISSNPETMALSVFQFIASNRSNLPQPDKDTIANLNHINDFNAAELICSQTLAPSRMPSTQPATSQPLSSSPSPSPTAVPVTDYPLFLPSASPYIPANTSLPPSASPSSRQNIANFLQNDPGRTVAISAVALFAALVLTCCIARCLYRGQGKQNEKDLVEIHPEENENVVHLKVQQNIRRTESTTPLAAQQLEPGAMAEISDSENLYQSEGQTTSPINHSLATTKAEMPL